MGVLEKRWEDVLIRHNHIPLCPWASIKSALAASAGLSGPAGPTVGTSRTEQSRRVIKKYCVVAGWVCVEFAEFWVLLAFYKPLPSVSAATLPHLHHQILNISNPSLFLSLYSTLRYFQVSNRVTSACRYDERLPSVPHWASKEAQVSSQGTVCHSFISLKGLSVKFIKIRAFFFQWQARVQ